MKNKISTNGPKNLFLFILFVLGTLMAISWLTDYTNKHPLISYSAFLNRVESGDVRKIYVTGQNIQGIFKNNEKFITVMPQNQSTWDELKKHDVEITVESPGSSAALWYFLMFVGFMLGFMMVAYFIRQARGQGGGGGGSNIFGMGKSKARLFMPSTIKEKFTSVAGADGAKEELQDIVDYLKDPKKYQRLGAKITRGVLLVGEPGNGKTLLAKAVAGEANCPFFSISGSDFIEVFVGVGAARVRDLFAQARKHSPCIIFIDEIDAVGRQRGSGLGGGHDEREQTLNQLLTEMDGFLTTSSVIVLAATNRPDVLDKALLRPGRFDRRVEVPFPDLKSREAILKIHAANIKIDPEVDLGKIARGTPGFSGADLANLINEAAILASKHGKNTVMIEDFEEARDKVLLGKEWKTAQQTDNDRRITAYHEAGHALVRLLNPEHSDPLYKISIVPRGRALGVTHSLPEREKFTSTKEEIEAHVRAALGGRAAEEIVFNKITTGAYSDFKTATGIVRTMVCKYGMSNLGPVVYSNEYGEPGYSEKTSEKIDEEILRMVQEYYEQACQELRDNRAMLDQLAAALLEKETLYAAEVYELLGLTPREDHRFA